MSEQPKWTPGPWRYCPQNASPTTGEHMISGEKPGYLAEVRDCGSGDVRANAHLIAAAPDLYAALERAENYIANTESELGLTLQCGEVARAALAKARGQP